MTSPSLSLRQNLAPGCVTCVGEYRRGYLRRLYIRPSPSLRISISCEVNSEDVFHIDLRDSKRGFPHETTQDNHTHRNHVDYASTRDTSTHIFFPLEFQLIPDVVDE